MKPVGHNVPCQLGQVHGILAADSPNLNLLSLKIDENFELGPN